jgi:predicted dehydrogenase
MTSGENMDKTIKVGVITNAEGAHLGSYFPALAQTAEAETVVLADPSGRTVAEAKKALGAKLKAAYKDTAEMLRQEQPQMALVSLEARLAPPAIDAALEAGCHVFCEKPSCVRAEDFAPLVRKAQQKHRHLMLAMANRVHAPVREARRIVRDGLLGKLYGVEIHMVADQARLRREAYRKEWYCIKARGGGGNLIWLGIHWLDLALFISGLKVKQTAGFAGVVGGQPIDIEDSAAVALHFNNGTFGAMTAGYYLDHGYQSHIQIWGEHGWLRLASIEDLPLEWYSSKDTKAPKIQRFEYAKGQRSYTPFVRAAVRASAGLEDPPITGEEGLHVLQTIFAFYKAAETGRTQSVQ